MPQTLAKAWVDYKETGDRDLREKLILQYQPLVRYVVGRVGATLPASVDRQDLQSYGLFGLIDAIDRFDLSRNIKFETYAVTRIRGSIMDELRSLDWVPRSVRSKAREIDKAYAAMEGVLGRSPTDREVADHLGLSIKELAAVASTASATQVLPLDEIAARGTVQGDDRLGLHETLTDTQAADPSNTYEIREAMELISTAVTALPEDGRTVVTLYYLEGLTFAAIADVLGVTESRICQVHRKAMLHLVRRPGT